MGFLNKCFGSRQALDHVMTPELATKIVQDYGAALASAAPPPGCVADARTLPHSKQRIKQALLFALSVTKNQQVRNQLKVGYISLADWQDGVGDRPVGLDVSVLDQSADTPQLEIQVSSQGAEIEKWSRLVQEEQAALKGELERLQLW